MSILRRAGICFFLLIAACTQNEKQGKVASRPATSGGESLRVCIGTSQSILMVIAAQKGFFAKEGITVEILPFTIGREAMEAMLAGSCDVTTSGDTPVADYGMKRDDLRVIAGISKSDNLSCIVARKASGIQTAPDLKGHKVGVVKGTTAHFFLDFVLNRNRMTEKDLQLQFSKGEELNKSLRNGTLSAVATTDLNAKCLQEELGEALVLITDPGMVLNYGFLSTLDSTLTQKRGALKRLLAGLLRADRFAAANPDEARRLFAGNMKVSAHVTDQVWGAATPRLTLEPAMILTLEDNARWLREQGGGKCLQKSFKEIIRSELLKEVSPESVTLN